VKIFYDTEFLEDGQTINLISIGMVREDGREYYAIVDDPGTIHRAVHHDWLRGNVLPHLPLNADWYHTPWDSGHPDAARVKLKPLIAAEVRDFILAEPDPQLWAWYGAYDHVVLCQLWGRMIDLPEGVPMWTNDLKQECVRLGNPRMPAQESGEHNALADARHVKVMAEALQAVRGHD
jgi:hypothetical protein